MNRITNQTPRRRCSAGIIWAALAAVILLTPPPSRAGQIIFVDGDRGTAQPQTGLSWDEATSTIQSGIQLAVENGADQVWVAEGLYRESVLLDVDVSLYGGFQGNESTSDLPLPALADTIIDADGAWHGLRIDGAGDLTVEGFIIENGQADDTSSYHSSRGGGVYVDNPTSGITLKNCTIRNNAAVYGGGIFADMRAAGLIQMIACDAQMNSAQFGGGIYLQNSEARISQSSINQNGAYDGGGIYASNSQLAMSMTFLMFNLAEHTNGVDGSGGGAWFENSVVESDQDMFIRNTARSQGGAVGMRTTSATLSVLLMDNLTSGSGGGLYAKDSTPHFIDSVIHRNQAIQFGGGVYGERSGGGFLNCEITSNTASQGGGMYLFYQAAPRLANTMLAFNRALGEGGALFCDLGGAPTLDNCVVHANVAGGPGGGLFCDRDSDPRARNTIWSENNHHAIYKGDEFSDPQILNCLFYANDDGIIYDPVRPPNSWTDVNAINLDMPRANDNVQGDPRFVDPAGSDFHIQDGSAAVDRGALEWAEIFDIDAEPRPGADNATDIGVDENDFAAPALDTIPPVSRIQNLPKASAAVSIDVDFRASDAESGVDFVQLEYQQSGGPWTTYPGQFPTTGTIPFSAATAGGSGRYWLRTIATDRAGNVETKTGADAEIILLVDFTGDRLHVTETGTGLGTSWGDAIDSINDAVYLASIVGVQEVRVAGGTYNEALTMRSSVRVFGGYAGSGADPDAQDTEAYPTVIDGQGAWFHVVTFDDVRNTELNGITIKGGKATGPKDQDQEGAGIYCAWTNATNRIANCVITGNEAAGYGGGMFLVYKSSPLVIDCRFENNISHGQGGGVALAALSDATFINCDIQDNTAPWGAGIYAEESEPYFGNTILARNNGAYGGAVFSYVRSNVNLHHCTLVANTALEYGGAIYAWMDSGLHVTNTAITYTSGSAIHVQDEDSRVLLRYNLFHENNGGHFSRGDDVVNPDDSATSSTGNREGDPMFANPDSDFHLTSGSAAIDTGNVGSRSVNGETVAFALPFDKDMRLRPHDVPGVGADGTGTEYDIGAYEFDAAVAPTPPPSPTPIPTPPNPLDWDEDGKPNDCESSTPSVVNVPGSIATHIWLPDSDGDGLLDGEEAAGACIVTVIPIAPTHPRQRDTDGDGFTDGMEALILNTDPRDPNSPDPTDPDFQDMDGDGIPELYDLDDRDSDYDGDRFLDGYEVVQGYDYTDSADRPPLGDVNNDGLANNIDAIMIFNYAMGNITTLPKYANADPHINGWINTVDAIVLYNWSLGNIPLLPIWGQ